MNSIFGFHCYFHGERTTPTVFRMGVIEKFLAALRQKFHIIQFPLVGLVKEMELLSRKLLWLPQ